MAEKSASQHLAWVEERLRQAEPFASETTARPRVRFGRKAAEAEVLDPPEARAYVARRVRDMLAAAAR
jgi:hypothetical protein